MESEILRNCKGIHLSDHPENGSLNISKFIHSYNYIFHSFFRQPVLFSLHSSEGETRLSRLQFTCCGDISIVFCVQREVPVRYQFGSDLTCITSLRVTTISSYIECDNIYCSSSSETVRVHREVEVIEVTRCLCNFLINFTEVSCIKYA
jgi:hypothetical protein